MLPPEVVSAFAALFIVAMVWLRTRMQYSKGVPGVRALSSTGVTYFAALAVLLVLGWFAAPALAHDVSSTMPIAPTLARVVWFLAVYYLFIPLHRALRARGLMVFRSRED
jgi:hypothetical protein